MFLSMFVGAAIAGKGQEKQASHVKSRQARGDETDNPQEEKAVEGLAQNFIFAEKSGERKNSGYGQSGDGKRFRSIRNFFPQPAHLSNVLFAGHGVNHAACAKEQ